MTGSMLSDASTAIIAAAWTQRRRSVRRYSGWLEVRRNKVRRIDGINRSTRQRTTFHLMHPHTSCQHEMRTPPHISAVMHVATTQKARLA